MAVATVRMKKSLFKEKDNVQPRTETDHVSANWSLEKKVEKNDERFGAGSSTFKKRPMNLQDLVAGEDNLVCDTTEANFSLEDISESEEIWVIDVPKTINPKNLKGLTMKLGKNNDFQIGSELYETSSVESNNEHLSFVFNTGRRKRPYKTVNVTPEGSVRIRQKLSNVLDANLVSPKKACVPFPKNLKLRHPLFGRNYNEKLIPILDK